MNSVSQKTLEILKDPLLKRQALQMMQMYFSSTCSIREKAEEKVYSK